MGVVSHRMWLLGTEVKFSERVESMKHNLAEYVESIFLLCHLLRVSVTGTETAKAFYPGDSDSNQQEVISDSAQ